MKKDLEREITTSLIGKGFAATQTRPPTHAASSSLVLAVGCDAAGLPHDDDVNKESRRQSKYSQCRNRDNGNHEHCYSDPDRQ